MRTSWRHQTFLALLAALAGALAGCQGEQFRWRTLGQTDYPTAYRAGLSVFANYYSVESADPQSGRIVGRPQEVSNRGASVLSTAPDARELAVLWIRHDGQVAQAGIRVDIQRQAETQYETFTDVGSPRDVPNQAPSERGAALSTAQQQAWRTVGQNYQTERQILQDIYDRLRAPPATGPVETAPATAPATVPVGG